MGGGTVIESPDEWRDVAESIAVGDILLFGSEKWKVTKRNGIIVHTECISSPHLGASVVGPASGKLDKAISTRESGVAHRYGRVQVLDG